MHIGRHNSEQKYYMRSQLLESVKEEKDLWIWLSSDMIVTQQCSKTCSKAYRMSGLIKRTIDNKNKEVMLRLYKSLVRPHVDYCSSAWSPHYVKNKIQVEKVQRRFTKMIPEMRNHSYEARLKKLHLRSLEERRNRSDIIEVLVFKMFKCISAIPFETFFQNRTRGHSAKIKKNRYRTDLRKHFFSVRVVNRWNSIKEHTIQANDIISFKRHLEKERNTRMDLFMD